VPLGCKWRGGYFTSPPRGFPPFGQGTVIAAFGLPWPAPHGGVLFFNKYFCIEARIQHHDAPSARIHAGFFIEVGYFNLVSNCKWFSFWGLGQLLHVISSYPQYILKIPLYMLYSIYQK
jgi:hypothetical protein